jgi:hypothetical protein
VHSAVLKPVKVRVTDCPFKELVVVPDCGHIPVHAT